MIRWSDDELAGFRFGAGHDTQQASIDQSGVCFSFKDSVNLTADRYFDTVLFGECHHCRRAFNTLGHHMHVAGDLLYAFAGSKLQTYMPITALGAGTGGDHIAHTGETSKGFRPTS